MFGKSLQLRVPNFNFMDTIVSKAKAYLDSLDSIGLPERLIDNIRALREAIDAAEPAPELVMELGPEPGIVARRPAATTPSAAHVSGMNALGKPELFGAVAVHLSP